MTDEHFARIRPIVGSTLTTCRVAVFGLAAAAPIIEYLAASGVARWYWHPEFDDSDSVIPKPNSWDQASTALQQSLTGLVGWKPLTLADLEGAPQISPERRGRAEGVGLTGNRFLGAYSILLTAYDWTRERITNVIRRRWRLDTHALSMRVSCLSGSSWLKRTHAEYNYRFAHALQQSLQDRHGAALSIEFEPIPSQSAAPMYDLILACGHGSFPAAYTLAASQQIPALFVTQHETRTSAQVWFPADAPIDTEDHTSARQACPPNTDDPCHAPLIAGLARAILLQNTPYARTDLATLWQQGLRIMQLGGAHPFDLTWSLPHTLQPAPQPAFHPPYARRGNALIVGLGSIGSVAAAWVTPYTHQLILADPDHVEATNPARQYYRVADIGQPKAVALKERLRDSCPTITAIPEALQTEEQVNQIITAHAISAALIATGSDADFAIARALRARGIPHIVARCYPRARYWEAILVDGHSGPAFEDIRGHLRVGPTAAPTPEQVAAYSDLGTLEAEPATLIESGWAAAWAARLIQQLATPTGLRERWFLELLATEHTCLVGGAYVEQTANGPAYGVDLPGRIWAWRAVAEQQN